MSEISDRRLAEFRAGIDASPVEIACLAHELTERRAADLTAEEREALSWVRDTLRSRHAMAAPTPRALAALERLLGGKS